MKFTAKNEKQTMEIGREIAAKLKGGDIVLLYGDLGAGKTTMVKGMAIFFGIKKKITSPTFTLMNLFEIQKGDIKKIVHIDTYRLQNEQELIDIGVEDYLGAADTVCLVEWPEKMKKILKNKKTLKIKIEHLNKGRLVEFS